MATDDPRRLVTEIAELFPPQKEWTEEDYFSLPETNRFIELSDGELIMPPHPTDDHQFAVGKLHLLFAHFVDAKKLGEVRISPLPVRLWAGKIREPDLVFVTNKHRDRIGNQYWGPPDLVVEVFSPSTRRRDEIEKFREYAQARISEYWQVDTKARTVSVFVLEPGGYRLYSQASPSGRAKSKLLRGFQVEVSKLFRN